MFIFANIVLSSCNTYHVVSCNDFEQKGIHLKQIQHFFPKHIFSQKSNFKENINKKNEQGLTVFNNQETNNIPSDKQTFEIDDRTKIESIENDNLSNNISLTENYEDAINSSNAIFKNRLSASISNATTDLSNLYQNRNINAKSFKNEFTKIEKNFKAEIKNIVTTNSSMKSQSRTKGDGSGLSITGFISSIIGLIVAAVIFGLIAVVFSCIGLSKGGRKGLAIAGLIIGVVDLIFGFLILAGAIVL